MRLGKLDNDQLLRLVLDKFTSTRPESLGQPGIGRDCAYLDLAGDLTVLSCDPITSAGIEQLGRLTVHVNCNDAAAAGAEPVGLLVTLLAPPTATESDIHRIATDLADAAKRAHVDVLGGHTEVTDGVNRFITATTVVAKQAKGSRLTGMKPGDDLVMTKWAGLEGTLLIAEDYKSLLSTVPNDLVCHALELHQYLSVVPESRVALDHGVTAMHDVTEGGILGAVWEMAYENGCGVEIRREALPLLPETACICSLLNLDPFKLISSGSMLIACTDGMAMVSALENAQIPCAFIGKATDGGIRFADGTAIDPPGADEIYTLVSYK